MFQNWNFFAQNKAKFFSDTESITMQKKRGGILDIVLQDKPTCFPTTTNFTPFETKDSMGANFINFV
jgi:hydroxymethylglutaryl-CoA reductase